MTADHSAGMSLFPQEHDQVAGSAYSDRRNRDGSVRAAVVGEGVAPLVRAERSRREETRVRGEHQDAVRDALGAAGGIVPALPQVPHAGDRIDAEQGPDPGADDDVRGPLAVAAAVVERLADQ